MNTRVLLSESWNDPRLSLLEKKYINPFVANLERFVVEAKLSPEQISKLFTDVEAGASAAGGNRTGIGKAVDVAKLPVKAVQYIDQQIDKLGRAIQNSGPVKNIDAKFDQLKAKLDQSDSKVVQGIKAVSDWAKANPGKASLAVGILTTAAAMAGGPMGGAVAGFLARATKDLLQGEQLSTAVGKSIKTAAYGAIAGWALRGIGDWLEGLRADAVPYERVPGLTQVNVGLTRTLTAPGFSSTETLGSMIVPQERAQEFIDLVNQARGGDTSAFRELWNFTRTFNVRDALADINATQAAVKAVAIANDQFLKNLSLANDAIAAIAQGTVSGKMSPNDIKVDGKELKPEAKAESKKFTALQIETLIEWCDETPSTLTEGPLDALKKGAAAVGGALKKGAAKVAQVGKNLTTKVTADKLNKAWTAAGKPDDSNAIADILRKAGVSDEVLAPIYKQMGATLPPAPEKPAADAGPGGTTPSGNPRVDPTLDNSPAANNAASQSGDTNATPQPAGKSAAPSSPAPAGTTAPTASGTATAAMDFKGIQQAVAKLNPAQAKELVTHIDSLNKSAAPASGPAPQAAPAQPGQTTQPAAGAAANAQQPAKAAPVAGKNAASGDTYEKAKGDIRKVQSGAKPLPANIAQGIEADLAKLSKGDKESGVFAADKIMKLAKLGMDVKDVQAKWIANSKAGERFLTQSQYFEITKMLREHGLSWSSLGLRVYLLEGTNKYFGISQI